MTRRWLRLWRSAVEPCLKRSRPAPRSGSAWLQINNGGSGKPNPTRPSFGNRQRRWWRRPPRHADYRSEDEDGGRAQRSTRKIRQRVGGTPAWTHRSREGRKAFGSAPRERLQCRYLDAEARVDDAFNERAARLADRRQAIGAVGPAGFGFDNPASRSSISPARTRSPLPPPPPFH